MAVGNANLMKQINLNNVRRVIREAHTATKPQLAKLTGLSVVTINSLVETLLDRGELLLNEIEVTSGGRPATAYTFNAEFSLALIVYTNEHEQDDLATVAVVNLNGDEIDREEITFHLLSENAFDSTIRKMLEKHKSIKSIGIGLPGQVVHGQIEAVDYAAFDAKAFIEHLSGQFQVPLIFENDVNAAVLGYCTTKQYMEKSVVGIYIPEKYPLGAGILIKGDIFKGKDGLAGEAKYLQDGMNWTDPAAVTANISLALKNLIVLFTCLLNPDRLVIYREGLTREMLAPILVECQNIIPAGLLPEVALSAHFHEDFANGIKQIALQPLLPQLNGKDC